MPAKVAKLLHVGRSILYRHFPVSERPGSVGRRNIDQPADLIASSYVFILFSRRKRTLLRKARFEARIKPSYIHTRPFSHDDCRPSAEIVRVQFIASVQWRRGAGARFKIYALMQGIYAEYMTQAAKTV